MTILSSNVCSNFLTYIDKYAFGRSKYIRADSSYPQRHALTIAQLIKFNSTKLNRERSKTGTKRHNRNSDTTLPLYIGMLLHAQTRKRGLVDRLFDLGISASYDRVFEVSIDLGNTVSTRFQQQKVVVPTNFHKGVFTTGAVDNIDYNPSSNTANG